MLTGTFLCIFFVPVFYALIIQIFSKKKTNKLNNLPTASASADKETNHA